MIAAGYQDKTLLAMVWLSNRAELVEVCGSRYFGDAKPGSDFDFLTDDEGLMNAACEIGFTPSAADKADYLDSNTDRILECGKVQLIQCKDLGARFRARSFIIANGMDRSLTENWEAAYEATKQY